MAAPALDVARPAKTWAPRWGKSGLACTDFFAAGHYTGPMLTLSTLQARDGLALALYHWPCERARGIIVLVHGLGEHLGRYLHVADDLNRRGWSVLGCDNRGHGKSQGPRGGVNDDEDFLFDTATLIDHARSLQPGKPLILLGHSLGGLIAGRFAAGHAQHPAPAWWRPIDGLVLSSPALDPGLNAVQKLLMATVSKWLPDLAAPNGLKPEWISRDPQVVRAYIADPLVHNKITGRVARFIVTQGLTTRDLATKWKLPTLLLYSGPDRCVASSGSDEFDCAAPKDVVRSKRYDQLAHEIFNEPEQAQVLADVGAWLDQQFASESQHAPV